MSEPTVSERRGVYGGGVMATCRKLLPGQSFFVPASRQSADSVRGNVSALMRNGCSGRYATRGTAVDGIWGTEVRRVK